jgi:hypothetical protein
MTIKDEGRGGEIEIMIFYLSQYKMHSFGPSLCYNIEIKRINDGLKHRKSAEKTHAIWSYI